MQGIFSFFLKKFAFFPVHGSFSVKITGTAAHLFFFEGCAAILLSVLTDICYCSAAPDCLAASAAAAATASIR